MRIAGVGAAFPPNYYDQGQLLASFREHWAPHIFNLDRLEQIHRNVLVGGRYLALPMEEYPRLGGFGDANNAWIRVGREVGAAAIEQALAAADLTTADVDALLFVTVTGLSTPSLDALLVNRLRLPSRVKRMPFFGLGCAGGTAGVARAADFVRGFPDQVAVLLSVELCSLTLQREDLSIPNLIASGLFGDGAAAVVVTGAERPAAGPRVVATRSVFYPDSEQLMGWEISERGFRLVLTAEVPEVARKFLRRDVDSFLADQGLSRSDIRRYVAHPGGPKVLQAMQEALEVDDSALEATWRTLREVGNLSSTSVLLVLKEILERDPPEPGSFGLMLSMGPGFCSELVLLRWD